MITVIPSHKHLGLSWLVEFNYKRSFDPVANIDPSSLFYSQVLQRFSHHKKLKNIEKKERVYRQVFQPKQKV